MIPFRITSPILPRVALILAIAVSLAAAKRPGRKSGAQPQVDCKTMVDSLTRLYAAGDPTYLTWDFSGAKCDSSQLYTAYYYQGIGFLFISAYKEALYFLTEARDIGGPNDEEILYHLWTVYRKMDRYQEMERLTMELHQRYPGSLFLLEILDQWKTVKSPSPVTWGFSSKAAWARSPYLDHILSNRLRAETTQKRGPHRFRETGSATLKTQWDENLLQGFQGNLGGDYEYKGFSAEANWGFGYEGRRADPNSFLVSSGPQSILVDSNWNFAQGRIAAGYSITTQSGWNLGLNGSLFQLSKDWRAASLSHYQSYLFSDFMLIGYLDVQNHWIDYPSEVFTYTDPDGNEHSQQQKLDGLQSASFNLTPYFTVGRHSLGIGPTYYFARTHFSGFEDAVRLDYWEYQQSVSATASYGFEWRHWCRFAFGGSYGYDYSKANDEKEFTAEDVYSMDAGISLSF
jgi:hypothetical protein